MIALKESGQPVTLGQGYAIRTPGWRGNAGVRASTSGSTRSAVRGLDTSMDALDAAMAASNVSEVRQIDLQIQPVASGGPATRSVAAGAGDLELEIPDLGPDVGQLVLSIDDAGTLRWHLPESRPSTTTGASRGGGSGKIFRIPGQLSPPSESASAQGAQRSVLGLVGRKLLKVLVYPITDPVLGVVGEHFVNRWEGQHRPYRIRSFTPADFRQQTADIYGTAALRQMASAGRVLLFVHGTFSTSHGGFGQLPAETLTELHRRYDGRVIAFDHPTVGVDPEANVRWLLQQLPSEGINVDVICHSRGGLVSRALAEQAPTRDGSESPVRIRRVVFAGTPNNGTLLANPDHMVAMVDRLTTLLTLFPSGPITEVLEALITVIKVVAHGALSGLEGLQSMRPQGKFLSRLNSELTCSTEYFGIAANYTPTDVGLRGLVAGGADLLVDKIFGDAGNDLVVPTDGVFQKNGGSLFPIEPQRLLVFSPSEGVTHTSMFQHPRVSEHLLRWLG